MSNADIFELEAPQPGDVVRLPQHVSVNNLNIHTDGVTLTSSDSGTKTLVSHDSSRRGLFSIVVSADNVTLSNLKFSGENSIALRIDGNNCTLRNLEFENVKVAFIASGSNVDFKNITVKGFREDGIRIASDGFRGENIRIEDFSKCPGAIRSDNRLYINHCVVCNNTRERERE